jgi:hypothetical protein
MRHSRWLRVTKMSIYQRIRYLLITEDDTREFAQVLTYGRRYAWVCPGTYLWKTIRVGWPRYLPMEDDLEDDLCEFAHVLTNGRRSAWVSPRYLPMEDDTHEFAQVLTYGRRYAWVGPGTYLWKTICVSSPMYLPMEDDLREFRPGTYLWKTIRVSSPKYLPAKYFS